MLERGNFGKIQTQKSDRGRDAGKKHRLKIDPQAFFERLRFAQAVAHTEKKTDEDMYTIRHRYGQDDGRRGCGNRGEREPDIAGQTQGSRNGEGEDEHGCERADYPADQYSEENDHQPKAQRDQRRQVGHRRFGKCVVHHDHSRQIDPGAWVLALNLGRECAGESNDLGSFTRRVLARQLDIDE